MKLIVCIIYSTSSESKSFQRVTNLKLMWDVLIFKVLPRKKFPSDFQLLLMGSAESTEVHYACLLDPCNLVQVFLYSLHLLPGRVANFVFELFFVTFSISCAQSILPKVGEEFSRKPYSIAVRKGSTLKEQFDSM